MVYDTKNVLFFFLNIKMKSEHTAGVYVSLDVFVIQREIPTHSLGTLMGERGVIRTNKKTVDVDIIPKSLECVCVCLSSRILCC